MLFRSEDFAPCSQGDQIKGCTLAEAEACVDELVKLHGPLWNSPFLSTLPWLNRSSNKDRSGSQALMQQVFPGFIARYADRLDPAATEHPAAPGREVRGEGCVHDCLLLRGSWGRGSGPRRRRQRKSRAMHESKCIEGDPGRESTRTEGAMHALDFTVIGLMASRSSRFETP